MESDTAIARGSTSFPTTMPRLFAQSGSPNPIISSQAWAILAQIYWKPIYKYLRIRHHKNNEDAKDLTQNFFLVAIEGKRLRSLIPKKRSFGRSFDAVPIGSCLTNTSKRLV